jgi:hypothetical protein
MDIDHQLADASDRLKRGRFLGDQSAGKSNEDRKPKNSHTSDCILAR